MVRRFIPKSVEEAAAWYMRYISPLSLIGGVVADNLVLLRRVDLWQSNALLFSYLALAAGCIVLLNLIEAGRLRHPLLIKTLPLIPVITQFAFGGLFSGFFSLYSRSAAYVVSWIFVAVVAALLIGNERFVRFYMRFSFQMSVYFVVLFSFLIFFLPVVFRSIGPYMFLFSGVVSLILIAAFLFFLSKLIPGIVRKNATTLARSVAIIFIVFNVLYFTNAIPPLPLALKDAGIYHSLIRLESGDYRLEGEALPWYEKFLRYNTIFHRAPGERVYVWSAIFAPSGLSTIVLHEWQHYDAKHEQWLTVSSVQFPISGGRDGGYRGYSAKSDLAEGRWRVNVVTEFGQLIGRISFTVEDVPAPVPLAESVR